VYAGRADWTAEEFEPLSIIYGLSEASQMGTRTMAAQDLNGDGLSDFLLASEMKIMVDGREKNNRGTVRLFYGTEAWAAVQIASNAAASLSGEKADETAGFGLAPGADFDGDGHLDLAIGAPYGGDFRNGRTYLLQGSAAGWSGETTLNTVSTRTVDGDSAYDACGWSIATGDVTGNGFADLAIGCPLANTPHDNTGLVKLYQGGSDFFSGESEPIASIFGRFDDFEAGSGLQSDGDVNGDGINDLLIGSLKAYRGFATKSGKIDVYWGRNAESWAALGNTPTPNIGVHGESPKDYLGSNAAFGDLNGDGVSELLFGSGFTDTGVGLDAGSVYLLWGELP